jgi:hypothetical protein
VTITITITAAVVAVAVAVAVPVVPMVVPTRCRHLTEDTVGIHGFSPPLRF